MWMREINDVAALTSCDLLFHCTLLLLLLLLRTSTQKRSTSPWHAFCDGPSVWRWLLCIGTLIVIKTIGDPPHFLLAPTFFCILVG